MYQPEFRSPPITAYGYPSDDIAVAFVGGLEVLWAKGDECEACHEHDGLWLPATVEKAFKKGTYIIKWGSCGGERPTCTKDKCECEGKVSGTGVGDNRPLTAAQLRLPEKPPPRKRIVVNDDDSED